MAITTAISDIFAAVYEVIVSIFSAIFGTVEAAFSSVFGLFTSFVRMLADVSAGVVHVVGGVSNFVLGESL
jgi:phage-related protein